MPKSIEADARTGGAALERVVYSAEEIATRALFVMIGATPHTEWLDGVLERDRSGFIVTGNDLGRLGNTEQLPDETAVNEYKLTELSDIFIALQDDRKGLEKALHQHAHELLEKERVEEAWMTLLAFNAR